MVEPIVKTVVVDCDPARAFDIFANKIETWWPLDAHAVSAAVGKAARSATIEPHEGGAIYETMHDGGRADWGKVLVYEAGKRLAMNWHPGYGAEEATHVDVQFEPEGEKTRVTLTHSGWEIWADEATAKRDNYNSGWDFVLGERYAGAFH